MLKSSAENWKQAKTFCKLIPLSWQPVYNSMTNTFRQLAGIGISIVLAILVYVFFQSAFTAQQIKVLAVATLIISLWVTGAIPMPVVALLPLIFFPIMNIASIDATAAPYADKIIFLFMGGFMLGLAIEKWNLHKRIALSIVQITGTSGNRIILGFILATGLLSMWLSNTATTMMMFPIASSVIVVMQQNGSGTGNLRYFSVCIMLAIAYSSNFGGIATIIGTPPNVAYVGHLQKHYNYSFSFSNWMLLCLPLSLLLLFTLYLVMTKWLFPNKIAHHQATERLIKSQLADMGKMSVTEKRVLIIFISTAALWILKDLINKLQVVKLDDTMIALMGAVALFITPSGKKEGDGSLLKWEDTSKMAWGILILFGGGITLASQLEKAGLIGMLGNWIAAYAGNNLLLLIFLIALISIFVSEVMSNVAQVIVFAPVIAGMADALQVNPIFLGLPMALAASCASMLPMGTPPNAIVFASGHLQLKDMVKTGFVMNIVCVILITLFCYLFLPFIIPSITR
ncbi:MAG: DASS family sodium-coupled anion symporter [Chitinophagaceae bacterium]|nr:MAG: DASS family sodium-coupled anion symporter [Chitinophagaceae bacterium]